MTIYDEDLPTDGLPEEPELSQSDTPEPETPPVEAAPEPTPEAPPAPDLNTTVAQLAATMQAQMAAQQQQAEQTRQAQERQQQEQARPVALLDQEVWREKYYETLSRSSYDSEAAREIAGMNQELAREQAQQMIHGMREEMRLEMQADSLMATAARESLTPYGGLVKESDFTAVALEVFGGNRAQLAAALSPQNPKSAELRLTLADAAAGKALREGRITPGKPNPTPPANPRSAARPTPGAAVPVNEITDPDAVLAALWN